MQEIIISWGFTMPQKSHPRYHMPYRHDLLQNARDLRANMTPAEKKLWFDFLQGYHPRFLKQRIIDRYIVDFYCARYKLVIELDGDVYGTDQAEVYDRSREERLIALGLNIIRFTNEDVLKSFDDVVREIDRLCGKVE